MADSGCLAAYVTMPDKDSALVYCETLVRERLAACVNIMDHASSVYWWQDAVQRAQECVCFFKTTDEQFPQFLARAKELHPYEVPCIVAWPLEAGNPDFFNWIKAETTRAES